MTTTLLSLCVLIQNHWIEKGRNFLSMFPCLFEEKTWLRWYSFSWGMYLVLFCSQMVAFLSAGFRTWCVCHGFDHSKLPSKKAFPSMCSLKKWQAHYNLGKCFGTPVFICNTRNYIFNACRRVPVPLPVVLTEQPQQHGESQHWCNM